MQCCHEAGIQRGIPVVEPVCLSGWRERCVRRAVEGQKREWDLVLIMPQR